MAMKIGEKTEKLILVAIGLGAFAFGKFSGANFLIPAAAAFALFKILAKTKYRADPQMKAVVSLNGGYALWFACGALASPTLSLENVSDPALLAVLLLIVALKQTKWATYFLIAYQIFGLAVNIYSIADPATTLVADRALAAHVIFRILGAGSAILLIHHWRQMAKMPGLALTPGVSRT